jgi:hypothetical protein
VQVQVKILISTLECFKNPFDFQKNDKYGSRETW